MFSVPPMPFLAPLIGLVFLHLLPPESSAFVIRPPIASSHLLLRPAALPRSRRRTTKDVPVPPLRMCICINCARVTNCSGYHFVEDMHGQPHMHPSPTFEPRDGSPTINVNFNTVMSERAESEFERMMREHKAEEAKAEERAREGAVGSGGEGGDDAAAGPSCEVGDDGMPLYGEEKYDLSPVTTVEYDVVACEDYVEEMGCWVKNMPEEIRVANPDFVPT